MDDERCDKTDLLRDQCSHCRGLDEQAHIKPDRVFGFHAHFPGWCEFGDHRIEIGELIQSHPESFSYVHVSCANER